jgi:hypothetical protein
MNLLYNLPLLQNRSLRYISDRSPAFSKPTALTVLEMHLPKRRVPALEHDWLYRVQSRSCHQDSKLQHSIVLQQAVPFRY